MQELFDEACGKGIKDFQYSDLGYVSRRFNSINKEFNLDVASSLETITKKSEELGRELLYEDKIMIDTGTLNLKNKTSDEELEMARIFARLMHKDDSEI
jgi:hypothetical protein